MSFLQRSQRGDRLHAPARGPDDDLIVSLLIKDMGLYNIFNFNFPDNILWAVIHEDELGCWEVIAFEDVHTAWDYHQALVEHEKYPDYHAHNLDVMCREKLFGEGDYT